VADTVPYPGKHPLYRPTPLLNQILKKGNIIQFCHDDNENFLIFARAQKPNITHLVLKILFQQQYPFKGFTVSEPYSIEPYHLKTSPTI
jgi:hypothetical protein